MKITSKREIYVERERRVTIKFGPAEIERFCPACAGHRYFVTVDEAALARHTTSRHIFHLIEADHLHFAETGEGLLLVCLASLASAADINQSNTNYGTGEKNNKSTIL